jgi:hypothetical protein
MQTAIAADDPAAGWLAPSAQRSRLGAETFVQMLLGARGAAAIVRPVDIASREWR